jgi:hypothetical protein
MKYIKKFNERLEYIEDVRPEQVQRMEDEMGEWVIDTCDITLELNDYTYPPIG